jgi:hypothetical protein
VLGTRKAGTRVLVAGLAVAAFAAGRAAAAVFVIPVQARLAPVAGAANSAGRFSGTLYQLPEEHPVRVQALPQPGAHWQLRWKVSVPSLGRAATVTLRVSQRKGAPAVVHVLSSRCSTSAKGTLNLSGTQAGRIARGDAVVTVRARSARLRGTVRIQHSSG